MGELKAELKQGHAQAAILSRALGLSQENETTVKAKVSAAITPDV